MLSLVEGVEKADADPYEDPPRAYDTENEVQQMVGAPFIIDHDC